MSDHGSVTEILSGANAIEQFAKRLKDLKKEITGLEEIVQVLLNATSDSAFLIDTSGIILKINEAAARRLGGRVEVLVDTNIFDHFSREENGFREAYMEIVKHSGQPVRFEDEYKGEIFETSIHPIFDSDGTIVKFAIFFNDITEHKKSQDTLYRYSQIFSTVHDPMSFVDNRYIMRTVNNAFLDMHQKGRSDVIGRPISEIFGPEVFQNHVKEPLDRCLKGEKVNHQDWFDLPGGERRFLYMSFYPLLTKSQVVSGAVINAVDITNNRKEEEKLQKLSVTDHLTQIFNRVKFSHTLEEEIGKFKSMGTDVSLIMFDIDHFKDINDSYGHDVGDKVLRGLVKVVKSCIRESDVFARWGGEEFVILLPHTNLTNASRLAERIRHIIEKVPLEDVGNITCSFGASQIAPSDDADSLVKRADEGLYSAKRLGRNRLEVAPHPGS